MSIRLAAAREPRPSRSLRLAALTLLTLTAFAGNSLLCRAALRQTAIDPASFTLVRIVAGAVALALIARFRGGAVPGAGSWPAALALFGYAAAFSAAYVSLPAGTGALLLFGAVQATMIAWGVRSGERLRAVQVAGLGLALAGLVVLTLPGIAAPRLSGALLMLGAGIAWGIYSLLGKRAAGPPADPLATTAGNFLRAVVPAALLALALLPRLHLDAVGVGYALVSGALTSGVGYALWYTVLKELSATQAASVQLSVPVLAALGGTLFLAEPPTWRLAGAALLVLGGIALVVLRRGEGGAAVVRPAEPVTPLESAGFEGEEGAA